jgi:hypothetical protein
MPGSEADHSHSPRAEVKNVWSCKAAHPFVFMAWYLVTHRDNLEP